MNAPENSGRDQAGRFAVGKSGNPAGRPRGSRNATTLAAVALLDGEAERLTRAAIELALAGDIAALRLCLERLIPVRREAIDLNVSENVSIDVRGLSGQDLSALETLLVRMVERSTIVDHEVPRRAITAVHPRGD